MTFKTFVPKSIAAVIERRCHGARSRSRSCHTGDREHKNKKARITRVPRLRHMYRACTTPDTGGGGGPASGCACERIFILQHFPTPALIYIKRRRANGHDSRCHAELFFAAVESAESAILVLNARIARVCEHPLHACSDPESPGGAPVCR